MPRARTALRHAAPALLALAVHCARAPSAQPAASSGSMATGLDAGHVSSSPLLHESNGPFCQLQCAAHELCLVAIHTPDEAQPSVTPAYNAPDGAGVRATVLLAPDGGTYLPESIWYESGCVPIPEGCAANSCMCTTPRDGHGSLRYCPAGTTADTQCLLGPDGRPVLRCWAPAVRSTPPPHA